MDSSFKEISNLIKNGPIIGKENVFLEILDIVCACTVQDETKQYFSDEFLSHILKFSYLDSPYDSIIYKILINIFSDAGLSEKLCCNKCIILDIINLSMNDVINKTSKNADSSCMLLSNITRNQNNCEKISTYILSLSNMLQKIVCAFTTIGYNTKCSLDQLAMVLCNLSQLSETRNIMTQSNHCMLQKLVPFMNHENAIRRRGIVGVIHNCAFDSTIHNWMLSDDIDVLPRLLLPLAGPEQFDDEDNDKLPLDLQYLSDTKTREPNPEIRKLLLETINQLCATKFGRQYLRDHNTYIILRELHKWEENPSALLACENVVDIIIRTEDEIGFDQLNTVEIPPDLEDKFNKELDSLV